MIVADLVRILSALEEKQCTYLSLLTLNTVSPFDEKLAEDNKVNRLEDSYLLWKSVCACKLLARTQLILCTYDLNSTFFPPSLTYSNFDHYLLGFTVLNKCDLLQAKLQRGMRIRDSVPSFGDRKNDLHTATRCMCFLLFVSPNIIQAHLTFLPFTTHT